MLLAGQCIIIMQAGVHAHTLIRPYIKYSSCSESTVHKLVVHVTCVWFHFKRSSLSYKHLHAIVL